MQFLEKINKKLAIGILLFQAFIIIGGVSDAKEGEAAEIFFIALFTTTPLAVLGYEMARDAIENRVSRVTDGTRIIAIANQSYAIFFGLTFNATLVFLVVDRFVQKRKVRELKEASLRAEVESLKTQINPHFFFNTLNNLYGLTVEKSDVAPEVILKLSDMMRYTIYEGEKDCVPLKNEITYLESFIELQKIRFQRELDIKFEHFIEEEDIKVPPLLFIVLVENAFKHGAESLTENAFIHMKLMSMNGSLLFESHNNFEAEEIQKSEGIGLKNLQRRLELLFPEKHSLTKNIIENNTFEVMLRLDLS